MNETFIRQVTAITNGNCEVVFMWWTLKMDMDGDVILNNGPSWVQPVPEQAQVKANIILYAWGLCYIYYDTFFKFIFTILFFFLNVFFTVISFKAIYLNTNMHFMFNTYLKNMYIIPYKIIKKNRMKNSLIILQKQ